MKLEKLLETPVEMRNDPLTTMVKPLLHRVEAHMEDEATMPQHHLLRTIRSLLMHAIENPTDVVDTWPLSRALKKLDKRIPPNAVGASDHELEEVVHELKSSFNQHIFNESLERFL